MHGQDRMCPVLSMSCHPGHRGPSTAGSSLHSSVCASSCAQVCPNLLLEDVVLKDLLVSSAPCLLQSCLLGIQLPLLSSSAGLYSTRSPPVGPSSGLSATATPAVVDGPSMLCLSGHGVRLADSHRGLPGGVGVWMPLCSELAEGCHVQSCPCDHWL